MQRDRLPGNAVDQFYAYWLPGTAVDQFRANAVIGQMGISPMEQGREHWEEIFTAFGEQILIPYWPGLISLLMQDTAFHQVSQAAGQYGGRKPQALLEFIKPR
ncbi:hypothetical protein D3C87_1979530 [compost metagenome]